MLRPDIEEDKVARTRPAAKSSGSYPAEKAEPKRLDKTGLLALKAIDHEAAVGVLAPVNGCAEAGRAVLRLLDSVDKLRFFHLTGGDAEFLGLLLYLRHCHTFLLFCLHG